MTDDFFQYHTLSQFLQQSAGLRLLRSSHAAMSISFLYKVFRQQNSISLPLVALTQQLGDYLASIGFLDEGEGQADLAWISTDHYSRADTYLKRWAEEDHRFIYINLDEKTREPYVTLTRHTEKVFQALELMREKDFVGTESKLLDLFGKVEELVQRTQADPEARVRELQARKRQIDEEIRVIRKSGEVPVFEPWQIRSRWADIERLAGELGGDFREVEENFKEIYRQISHRHADATLSKGQLLRLTFDALEELRSNDQGRSFYAFWDFLMDDEKQQVFQDMLHRLYNLLDDTGVDYGQRNLLQLKYLLHAAGVKVLETNQLLGYKLSRIVVEKEKGDRRKTRDTLNRVLQHALQHTDKQQRQDAVMWVDDYPDIRLPLERRPGEQPVEAVFSEAPHAARLSMDELTDLRRLVDDTHIDKARLAGNIRQLLQSRVQVTLGEVVDAVGLQQGLAELLAYVSLAVSMQQVSIHPGVHEDIAFDPVANKFLQVPQIIFSRGAADSAQTQPQKTRKP